MSPQSIFRVKGYATQETRIEKAASKWGQLQTGIQEVIKKIVQFIGSAAIEFPEKHLPKIKSTTINHTTAKSKASYLKMLNKTILQHTDTPVLLYFSKNS
jgi:tRNA U34 5-carboxymethylaminomethyl modifying GTPase MnmE/TrmE